MIDNQLNNQKFVDNAPAEILEEKKTLKVEALSTREKLEKALEQLVSM